MKLRHKAVSRAVIRKALRPIPIIGTGAVLLLAMGTIRRKGFLKGGADIMLDLVPIVGSAKGVIEVFTGDFLPDKKTSFDRAF